MNNSSARSYITPLKLACLSLLLLGWATAAAAADLPGEHAHSIYGEPKYPAGFDHFDYVNPNAPKGGSLRRYVVGNFDSLNPWITKGTSASGISLVYESLTSGSLDEPFTQYGLLAERIDIAPDRSSETFYLNPKARFSDGTQVTAADVVYSFRLLVDKGSPFWGFYYQDVEDVKALDKLSVKFTFVENASRELPLIIGQMPVMPKHYWLKHDFTSTSLEAPIGSGPYKIVEVEPGKRIVYQRREDYWGKELGVNKGLYNFDTISFDYYRDATVALQAFKAGAYDFRIERSSKKWATGYAGKALKTGKIIKENFPSQQPAGMQGFVFNLRKPLFQDRQLRHAISLAFDFQWTNRTLFYGQYTRSRSYFANSEMAALGLPSADELKLLAPYREQLPEEVFTQAYQPAVTTGAGWPRQQLIKAQQLLADAGYTLEDNQLYTPDGQPVAFEFLLRSPAFERVVLPFIHNLATLGIKVTPVKVDQPQYLERVRRYAYDMIVASFPQSASPGNEQRIYWSSQAAKRPGSQNYIGLNSKMIDSLVDTLIAAKSRQQLITRCRALDRVLQWGYYLVPNWYIDHFRVAYRHTLAHPQKDVPLYSLPVYAWWSHSAEEAK